MNDKSFTIRVPKRWVRTAMVVATTALIVAPLTAIASHTFNDVGDSNTFHNDIDWLAGAGITKGCNPPTNDQFCPNDAVTRGQMAAFMKRFAGYIDAEDGTPGEADNADTLDGKHANQMVRVETGSGGANIGESGSAEVAPTSVSVPSQGYIVMTATFEADLGNCCGDAGANLQFVVNGTPVGPIWLHEWELAEERNAVSVQFADAFPAGTHEVALRVTRTAGFVNADNAVMTLMWTPFDGTGSTPTVTGATFEPLGASDGDTE